MSSFEVHILPTISGEQFSLKDAVWYLTNKQAKECTALALQCVSDKGFNRIHQVLMSPDSTTFSKIVNKWNTALIGFMTYYCTVVGRFGEGREQNSNSRQDWSEQ
jgi:pre-mRNA-processing factor 8